MILKSILLNNKITVYGNGDQVREWLYVDDHCDALLKIIIDGKVGENYNISDKNSITNLNLVKLILSICKDISIIKNDSYEDYVIFIKDRPGHDKRYAINSKKLYKDLKWEPKMKFQTGLLNTINFYTSSELLGSYMKKVLYYLED